MRRFDPRLLAAGATLVVTSLAISSRAEPNGPPAWILDAAAPLSGGTSSGPDWSVTGTIGEPITGDASGGDWLVASGFEPAAGATGPPPPPPCPADFDGGGDVGFSDLVELLSAWGVCPGCPADLDGSGTVDFADLVETLAAWGPCP